MMRTMSMGQKFYVLATSLLVLALVILPSNPDPASTVTSTALKVLTESGHGSGVHIGNGFVITATHVLLHKGEPSPEIKLQSSAGAPYEAELLWFNVGYDIAMLRSHSAGTLPAANLSCREAKIGDRTEAVGNPFDAEFIHAYGRVAGGKVVDPSPWKTLMVISGPIGPGMSGGPVFFRGTNEIVGLGVASYDEKGSSSFMLAVPAPTICDVMGRS